LKIVDVPIGNFHVEAESMSADETEVKKHRPDVTGRTLGGN